MAMFDNYFIRFLCKANGELSLYFDSKRAHGREYFGDTPKITSNATRNLKFQQKHNNLNGE